MKITTTIMMKLRLKWIRLLILPISLLIQSNYLLHAQEKFKPDSLNQSNRYGLEYNLQGQIAGLLIKNWTGTPGSQSTINLRGIGLSFLDGSTTAHILINGVPIISSPSEVTGINPLSFYSIEQIDYIEIIKDIDQLSSLGIQAPNGAINIIIKEGKKGPLHVNARISGGIDHLLNYTANHDQFYDFSPTARKKIYDKSSLINEQHLAIDGGGDYGSYLFGINNSQASGSIQDAKYQRQNLYVNAKYKIANPLSIQFYNNFTLANRKDRYAGQYHRDLSEDQVSDESFFMDDNKNISLLSSINVNYDFNSSFKLISTAGLSYETANRDLYIPSNLLNGQVVAGSESIKRQILSLDTYLSYQKSLNDHWKLNARLGNQLVNSDFRNTSVEGSKPLASGGSDYVKIVNGYNANQTVAFSNFDKEKLLSFYGQTHWTLKDKILINLVARADGSSLYAQKWRIYPAIGLTYDLEKDFNLPLQLKSSYGKIGQRANTELYRGELTNKGDYLEGNKIGIGELYSPYLNARSIDIRQFDMKVDYAPTQFINLQLAYFNKLYHNFTYSRFLPNVLGNSYTYETGGKIQAEGFEFSTKLNWIENSIFSWATKFNLAYHYNQIKSLPTQIERTSLGALSALSVGDPISSIIAFESENFKNIGSLMPKTFGGLSNDIKYGKFSLGLLLSFNTGAQVAVESFSSNYIAEQAEKSFPLTAGETTYHNQYPQENESIEFRGIESIEKLDFLRINQININYQLDDYIKKLKIKQASIHFRVDNLYTFSSYKGINPEENLTGVRRTDLRYTGTPLPTSFMMGLNLTF